MAVENSEQFEAKVIQKKPIDMVSAIIWLVLGIVVIHESLKLTYMEVYGPGPGFFSLWLGIGVVILSLLLLVKSWLQRKQKDDVELPTKHATKQIFFVMLGFFGFVFLSDKIGFLLCIGLLFFFLLTFVERKGWKFSLIIALVSILFFWSVFELGLEQRLPLGFLESFWWSLQ